LREGSRWVMPFSSEWNGFGNQGVGSLEMRSSESPLEHPWGKGRGSGHVLIIRETRSSTPKGNPREIWAAITPNVKRETQNKSTGGPGSKWTVARNAKNSVIPVIQEEDGGVIIQRGGWMFLGTPGHPPEWRLSRPLRSRATTFFSSPQRL
jgi:hypothetical protein